MVGLLLVLIKLNINKTQDDTSSTSSSGTSDDEQGGRRKKKGLKEKIKEKLTGHEKHKEHGHRVDVSDAIGPGGEVHHYEEHEKKSVIERIKEKLPGHHNHH